MVDRYPFPASIHRVEEEILRSRFITTVGPTLTPEDARAFVTAIKGEFANASHNCWAYLVGPPGSTSQVAFSDDGEPHGTAGRPMLTVLEHSGLGDITAVVTRYFGGVLLGKGGLVRAYSGGVKLALDSLSVAQHVTMAEMEIIVAYASIASVLRLFTQFEAMPLREDYAADVTYRVRLPADAVSAFAEALTTATNGEALVEMASQEVRATDHNHE